MLRRRRVELQTVPPLVTTNLDVSPPDVLGKTGAKRLRDCLFGGKSGGEMGCRVFHRTAVVDFACVKHPINKALAVAVDRILNLFFFYHIVYDIKYTACIYLHLCQNHMF